MFATVRKTQQKQRVTRLSVFTCSPAFAKIGSLFVFYSVGLADGFIGENDGRTTEAAGN
jgi:hypothetical protein